MKPSSKVIILLSCIVLTACNSGGSNTTPVSGNNGGGNTPTPTPTPTPSTYQLLYSFTPGTDGARPQAGLIQGSDGNFYGTTQYGGTKLNGTVFKITSQGVKTTLYSFTGGNDGGVPRAGLLQGCYGNLYGTTYTGGTKFNGTVFKITPQGIESPIYSFTGGKDGAYPQAGVIQDSDGNFYGTTYAGGGSNSGTVFKITPQGVESPIYSFTGGNDGEKPVGVIQGSDGNFYGTTTYGGNGFGTVFKLTPTSTTPVTYQKTILYSFASGNDGAYPYAGLVQGNDGNFYGTTGGGNGTGNGNGTIFKITTAGVKTTLYNFTGGTDGASPYAGLVQGNDGNFYGTTQYGGNGYGTVFKITPQGVKTTLYSFASGNDGAYPQARIIQGNDGNFYGTTTGGGNGEGNGFGTVFKIYQ